MLGRDLPITAPLALEPVNYFLGRETRSKRASQRLNMELDLQSLCGLHVLSCTHWLRSRRDPPPHPAFGLIYEGAIGQAR